MASSVITVKNIGKKFRLGTAHGGGYTTLRDSIASMASRVVQKAEYFFNGNNPPHSNATYDRPSASVQPKEFWALRNISFDVKQGEVIGIIGKNGAGKTTLLKILSQIIEPTEGEIRIRGRVASLLEVGTGFHPELTGRENIYMNGAILGMKRVEIRKNFDEIVAFAEVEKFIDTPVKRYSSGMYVRLAFAIAAHLEPEILLLDEVLAVGDVAFQKKCLGEMRDVAGQGRTVLFVSHNMGAIKNLCDKAILLENGLIRAVGNVSDTVEKYLKISESGENNKLVVNFKVKKDLPIYITSISASDNMGKIRNEFYLGEDLHFIMNVKVKKRIAYPRFSLEVESADGIPIYQFVMADSGLEIKEISDEIRLSIKVNKIKLYPGDYFVKLWASPSSGNTEESHVIEDAYYFSILPSTPNVNRPLNRRHALIHEIAEWKVIR